MTDNSNTAVCRPAVDYAEISWVAAEEREIAEALITIRSTEDIVTARKKGRLLAQKLGFSATQMTLVATVISELARNILVYAKQGEIALIRQGTAAHEGLQIRATDKGPGIDNIQRALISGYSTSGGLGLGLPGVRRMLDEFEICSEAGRGTQVTGVMWVV